jgi:hypothetical protein
VTETNIAAHGRFYAIASPEPAYAQLLEASYGPAGSGVVLWQHDGNDPPLGVAGVPLTGSLHYIDVGTGHTPEYQFNAHRSGIAVDAPGTVTIRFLSEFITVGWGPRTYTASIRLNGAVIASEDVTLVEGGAEGAFSWPEVLIADVAVQAGDVIEGWEGSLPGTVFLTPVASGPAGLLEVSGFLGGTAQPPLRLHGVVAADQ